MSANELKIYRMHPLLGAEMLEKIPSIPMEVRKTIAQHHEGPNGKGYPAALSAKDILPHAKIVAIADVFNDVMSGKGAGANAPEPLHPFRALEVMNNLRGYFDPHFLYLFTNIFLPKDT